MKGVEVGGAGRPVNSVELAGLYCRPDNFFHFELAEAY